MIKKRVEVFKPDTEWQGEVVVAMTDYRWLQGCAVCKSFGTAGVANRLSVNDGVLTRLKGVVRKLKVIVVV